ncbi:sigma 54-interacting transcriptional regulator [Sansalvadorimonas sp. 2012CJ34-2]|uniref:Sigma 54-interacting transcriptional regulator n=1 Tax=Parendozoicomonas callyspongiae TaxID=2942213 RepID=A0ABT0PGH9_9GAMM|nr:sigma 54-interacting transcriptional regulator [Sansalvadorimonas sp. 2012CJ34-2]MCL6270482.1 sigma 54-interacting transcriptional regulator [Sansalvadorimonas sp. 2012CJ34-2]
MSEKSASSVLLSVQSTVIRCAQVLAKIMKLDVEIIDAAMNRVAVTGLCNHLPNISERKTAVFCSVLKTRQASLIRNAGFDPSCQKCPSAGSTCHKTAQLALPLMVKGECVGVVNLVCFTEEQRQHLLQNYRSFKDYTENTVQLYITRTLEEGSTSKPQVISPSSIPDFLSRFADDMQQGVLLFSDAGELAYINTAACRQLELADERMHNVRITVRPFGLSNSTGREEIHYVLTIDGRERIMPAVQSVVGDYRALMLNMACEYQSKPIDAPESSEIIGNSAPIQLLRKQVRRVADSPSSVMIRGESGTGKEVFARAVHAASRRADKLFIAINCAAIPEQLLESELFGYVKGAFTGANSKGSEGLIRQADGGTLFLDEIGDMTLHLQAKLLRVLDRREVTPVGSSAVIPVDVRIISATHRDFDKLIGDGEFREDLFYRLNVIPLELPPLRKREGDIDLLIEYFLARHSKALARHRPALQPDTMECLRRWRWPGNIRELANMIEYLVNVADPTLPVSPNLLPKKMRLAKQEISFEIETEKETESKSISILDKPVPFENTRCLNIESMEKELIQQALTNFSTYHDCKQRAAHALGIGIATLYRKIKKYELEDCTTWQQMRNRYQLSK